MTEEIPPDGLSDEEVKKILSEYRRVAVVGFSRYPEKPAHYVPKFLIRKGYHVVPVNPNAERILKLKSYKSLLELDEEVDIVDVFRPSDQVLEIAEQVLKMRFKPKVFWMQEGIYSREAAELLKKNGITVIWNRCMMREHNRLFGSKPLIPMTKLK